MKVEFLCELDDQPAEVVVIVAGCSKLGAMNLRGAGYVCDDRQIVDLTGVLPNGRVVSVPGRVARARRLSARESDCFEEPQQR